MLAGDSVAMQQKCTESFNGVERNPKRRSANLQPAVGGVLVGNVSHKVTQRAPCGCMTVP